MQKVTAKRFKTNEEKIVDYDKLVVTTGSWPIIPPIKGIDSENILLCKTIIKQMSSLSKLKMRKKLLLSAAVTLESN